MKMWLRYSFETEKDEKSIPTKVTSFVDVPIENYRYVESKNVVRVEVDQKYEKLLFSDEKPKNEEKVLIEFELLK